MNQSQIEIHTVKAELKITNKIRRFRIERTPPKMEIKRTPPTFKINWDNVRAESGLKKPRRLMEDTRQKAYNKVLKAIKKIAHNGDMMMDISLDAPDMVPVIAEQNMRSALPEFNLVAMPQSMPEIEWDTGSVEITWTRGTMEIIWDEEFQPDISVTPYSVEVEIRNFEKMRYTDNGGSIEGQQVDKKI